jgi:hypothetical protein
VLEVNGVYNTTFDEVVAEILNFKRHISTAKNIFYKLKETSKLLV